MRKVTLKTKVLLSVAVLAALFVIGTVSGYYLTHPSNPAHTSGALDTAGRPANNSAELVENARRNKCLEASYVGLSIEQKEERSKELEAKAKAQGTSLYEAAGC